jgi:mRNA interferase RelE/StbE
LSYSVYITSTAEKEMVHLPNRLFQRITERILSLADNPRPKGCKKLEGDIKYRIRVGSYRFLYKIDDVERSVEIIAVGHRNDVYRI